MKRLFCILALVAMTGWGVSFAQNLNIIMGVSTGIQGVYEDVCYFYDPGGPTTPTDSGNFAVNCRDTLTIKNGMNEPGSLIVQFLDFALGYGDTLYIFDGQNCSATLIGAYNTVLSPEEITASGTYLTFVFHSDDIDDYGILKSGWKAQVYVVPTAPEEVWLTADNHTLETNSCNVKFYDSGGPNGNINAAGTYYCEFSSPVSHVKMEFEQPFSIGGVMKIYDGKHNDPERRLIGQFHSSTVDATIGSKPPVLFSSKATLCVEYVPGNEAGKSGWNATITCVPELFESPDGSACPQVEAEDENGIAMPDTVHHVCGLPIILNAKVTATGRYTNDYTVRLLDEFNPPFPFNQGTTITADVDDNWIPYSNGQTNAIAVPLPAATSTLPAFVFSFFGKNYTSVYPGANGLISFTNPNSTSCSWDSRSCPTSSNTPPFNGVPYLYKNCIYGVMEDIFPSHVQSGGAIRYGVMGDYPCRTFVFNYDNIGSYDCWSAGVYNSYQMVIYEGTNIIDVFIRHRGFCDSWNQGHGVVGLQNSTSSQMVIAPGRDFSNIGNDPTSHDCISNCWTANNEAWRFTPITPMDEVATIEWFENTVAPENSIGHTKRMVVDPQKTTNYIVKYHFTNAGNSSFDRYDTVKVIVDVPEINIDSINVCPGKTVELVPQFGDTTNIHPLSYKWSDGKTTERDTLTAVKTDTLSLTVHYDNNCYYTAKTIVTVDTMAVPVITGDTVICYGDMIRLVAAVDSPSYILRWANGLENSVFTARPTATADYVVKAVHPNDEECFTTDTFTVKVNPLPDLSFTYSPEEVVIEHGKGTLTCYTDCDPNYAIRWNFNDRYNPENNIVENLHTVSHDFVHVGSYDITLAGTNEFECRDSVTEHVRVYVPVSFVMPSAFTPNDDGLNDVFKPVYEGVEVAQYLMMIYDRAGRLVFKSTNPTVGWDGRDMNGLEMPSGVYVYYIHHWTQMDDLRGNGQPAVTGTFTLIR